MCVYSYGLAVLDTMHILQACVCVCVCVLQPCIAIETVSQMWFSTNNLKDDRDDKKSV